jgi:hypothetical protein
MLQPELIVRASAPALKITAENAESAERKPGTSAPSAVKLTSSTQGTVKAGQER